MKCPEGKTALVPDDARGIGRRICGALAREGAHIAVADLLGEDTEGTATAINGIGVQIAVTEACVVPVRNVVQHPAAPT